MKTTHIALALLLVSPMLLAEDIKIENLPQSEIYENWLISRCIGKSTDSEKPSKMPSVPLPPI